MPHPNEARIPSCDPTNRFYRPELDSLRFLAFSLVFLAHALPTDAAQPHWLYALALTGSFGVKLFFTLSAYLITELLIREKVSFGTCDIRSFYARRVLRIWPLYFFALGSAFIISHLRPGSVIALSGLVAYLFFLGNWYSVFHDYLPWNFGHLCSISVEEQFYLFWPLLIQRLSHRALVWVCAAAWVTGQVSVAWLTAHHTPFHPNLWINSFVQLQYFAYGAIVSLILHGRVPVISSAVRLGMIVTAPLLVFMPEVILRTRTVTESSALIVDLPEYLFRGMAAALLLLGFLGSKTLGGSRVLKYLGKISYGLYIYHLPLLLFLARLIHHFTHYDHLLIVDLTAVPLTILLASLSYHYLELPFLRIKKRFEIMPSRENL